MEINEAQMVAGRAILGWSQRDLARKLHISSPQVSEYEHGLQMSDERMKMMVTALQDAGVVFVALPEGRGVVLRDNVEKKPTLINQRRRNKVAD